MSETLVLIYHLQKITNISSVFAECNVGSSELAKELYKNNKMGMYTICPNVYIVRSLNQKLKGNSVQYIQ